MDELERVRQFREAVPAGEPEARERARAALLASLSSAADERRSLRGRRRGTLGVALAAIAIAGVAAGSAFGLGERLRDLIAGRPAPPPVAARLVDEATAERITPLFDAAAHAEAEQAHGVLAITTTAGPVALWTVPARGGPVCYFVEAVRLSERTGKPVGDSRCTPHPSPTGPIMWARSEIDVDGRPLYVLAGNVAENVGSVWLRSPDGETRRLELAERFFLGELPDEREPYTLIVRDATGAEIERQRINRFMIGVMNWRFRKVTGPERTILETIDTRGHPMRLTLRSAEGGTKCLATATRYGRGTTCREPEQLRTSEGIAVYPTLEGKMVYLQGSVGPEVETLTLEYQGGEQVDLPLSERFVLYDIPRAHFFEGERPVVLIGRNGAGEEVAREPVLQGAFGPNTSIWLEGDEGP